MSSQNKKAVKKGAKKIVKKAVAYDDRRNNNRSGKNGLIIFVVVLLLLAIAAGIGYFVGFFDKPVSGGFEKDRLTVYYLDVGQGDSILIRSPDDRFMLIDAGKNKAADDVVSMLKGYGVKTLEYLVLTHPDEDHVGGADVVLDNFDVKMVLSSDAGANTKTWRDVLDAIEREGCPDITVSVGNKYTFCEDCSFTVLGPPDTGNASNLNNQSVVLRMDYGETSFLFTGDAEKEEESAMLQALPASAFSSQVIKAGHHGSSTSSSEAFLDAVKPTYAVISCGKDNSYGHPHKETISKFEARGIQCFRTDEQGTVVIQSDKQTVSIVGAEQKSGFELLLDRMKSWFT